MLKTLMLTAASVALIASTGMANDDFLTELASADISSFADADISIDDDMLGDLDIDALSAEAGTDSDEAIEACFRRCGYRSYGHFNYGGHYGYGYNCYRPMYRHYYVHRPVYTYSYCPTYTYWGCY